jgi:regulator of protease activity HflC (stomatin/prohibitin superfamily)
MNAVAADEKHPVPEKTLKPGAGWGPLAISLTLMLLPLPLLAIAAIYGEDSGPVVVAPCIIGSIVAELAGLAGLFGLMAVQPNTARVLILFGEYKGTVNESGFYWVNPLYSKKRVSLRIRNFETGSTTTPEKKDQHGTIVQHKTRTHGRPSKVNDRDGNPIDISAVVVWKVVNTAEAMFEVDDYEDFVAVQSEAALRSLASRHPYDSEDHEISLRGSTHEVSTALCTDIQERLDKAGVKVIEARISHLAYAQEIASAMLQRQQAQAVVAARTKIVDGAVGMVQMALERLARDQVVQLDDERKASMVSNLLVVLCGGSHVQPIVNTGTMYH